MIAGKTNIEFLSTNSIKIIGVDSLLFLFKIVYKTTIVKEDYILYVIRNVYTL